MPKMTKAKAKQVDNSNSGFEPIEDGIYFARLVNVGVKEAANGNPYWQWEYKIEEEGPYNGRVIWDNTSLSDAALWRLNSVFKAFGVPADTDTDDMLGLGCELSIEQKVIEQGTRAGEIGNNVSRVLPAPAGGKQTPKF